MNLDSQNPVTGDVVWSGPTTTAVEVELAVLSAHEALSSWRSTALETRIDLVRAYASHLKTHQDDITQLISDEVGKLIWDARGEVAASIAKAELSIQALQERRATQRLDAADAAVQRVIRYAPIGVSLVLGPFNFPLHLPGGQIIPALLSGNTVVFKPSELATGVGQWMVQAWRSVGLPNDVLQPIVGGVETAVAAIDLPLIRGVFLTGSLEAGRVVHRQLAGRPEVLLALELGGNNPVVVTGDANPERVAQIVSFSGFISSGQRCTCARRVLFVDDTSTPQQIEALLNATRQLRVGVAGDQAAAQVGPLISEAAAKKMEATYQSLVELGCEPLIPWNSDSRFPCLVHPTVLDATSLDWHGRNTVGQMEWFGPLLVIERVPDLDTAIASAANTPYGLSASLLGGTSESFEQFVTHVHAGVVNWNGPTTGAAGALPFGGLKASGNHRPAGFHAIDFCADPVASLQRDEMPELDPWSIAQ